MEEFIFQENMPLNEGISESTIQEFNNLDLSNEKDKAIAELSKKGYQFLKENNLLVKDAVLDFDINDKLY